MFARLLFVVAVEVSHVFAAFRIRSRTVLLLSVERSCTTTDGRKCSRELDDDDDDDVPLQQQASFAQQFEEVDIYV